MASKTRKRLISAWVAAAFILQPLPAKARDDAASETLQTVFAVAVIVIATATPLFTAKKMLQTRLTDGVAPESYISDAVSNLLSAFQVTLFGHPSYYAAVGCLAPMLGDLFTAGVYYWVRSPTEREPFVKVKLQGKDDDTGNCTVDIFTRTERIYFSNCRIDFQDQRQDRSFCQRLISCTKNLCKRVVFGSLGTSETEEILNHSEEVIPFAGPPDPGYVTDHASRTSDLLLLKEQILKNETEKMSIIVYAGRLEILFPQYSKSISSANILVEEEKSSVPQ